MKYTHFKLRDMVLFNKINPVIYTAIPPAVPEIGLVMRMPSVIPDCYIPSLLQEHMATHQTNVAACIVFIVIARPWITEDTAGFCLCGLFML